MSLGHVLQDILLINYAVSAAYCVYQQLTVIQYWAKI